MPKFTVRHCHRRRRGPKANELPLMRVETELDEAALDIHKGAMVTWLDQVPNGFDAVELKLCLPLESIQGPTIAAESKAPVGFAHREHSTLEVAGGQA